VGRVLVRRRAERREVATRKRRSENKYNTMAAAADPKPESDIKGLDDTANTEILKLVSQDEERFSVTRRVALMSELVKTMIENDKEERELPLPNVKGSTLAKVVEYMKYHTETPAKEIEKPLKSSNMAEVVSQWDAEFVEVEQEMLFELILAANYMDIKPLLDLSCAKVASLIKGKTPEQIRKQFNIQNDFTPEEEEAVRAENKWAEES